MNPGRAHTESATERPGHQDRLERQEIHRRHRRLHAAPAGGDLPPRLRAEHPGQPVEPGDAACTRRVRCGPRSGRQEGQGQGRACSGGAEADRGPQQRLRRAQPGHQRQHLRQHQLGVLLPARTRDDDGCGGRTLHRRRVRLSLRSSLHFTFHNQHTYLISSSFTFNRCWNLQVMSRRRSSADLLFPRLDS
jgi:hypothetical protein